MSAFDLSRYVEEQGMVRLIPLLTQYAEHGQFTIINKGPLAPILQKTVGDALLNRNGGVYGLEVKVETQFTGNFFLETWSNKKFSFRKQGWLYTLQTDIFWYYFLDVDELYSMSFHRLWEWAFDHNRLFDFPEKQQRKNAQMNETWGCCVPIPIIEREVGYVLYNPSKSFEPVRFKDINPSEKQDEFSF